MPTDAVQHHSDDYPLISCFFFHHPISAGAGAAVFAAGAGAAVFAVVFAAAVPLSRQWVEVERIKNDQQ